MARREENPNQIIRKDAKSSFVEVLRGAYAIGKVQMNFISYDSSQQQGSRQKGMVSIYFSIPAFLRVSHDILSGKIYKRLQDGKGTANGNINLSMGGTKNNGAVMARTLNVFSGNAPFIFVAEQGTGKENSKGGYTPAWGKNPQDKIVVPMSVDDTKELFLMVEKDIQAYLMFKQMLPYQTYMNDLLEAIAKAQGVDITAAKNKLEETLKPYKKKDGSDYTEQGGYMDAPPSYNGNGYNAPPQNGYPQQNVGYNGSYAQPQSGYQQRSTPYMQNTPQQRQQPVQNAGNIQNNSAYGFGSNKFAFGV